MTLSFSGNLVWREWGNSTQYQERTAHFASRRSSQIPRSEVYFDIEDISLESFHGSTEYADNFSWELWNLRGYSDSWSNCNDDNISNIRQGSGSSQIIAYGDTLNDFQRNEDAFAGRSLTQIQTGGSVEGSRDANFCLIISETAGAQYGWSNVGECFHFDLVLNARGYIEGFPTWFSNKTIRLGFFNVGNPNSIPNYSYCQ